MIYLKLVNLFISNNKIIIIEQYSEYLKSMIDQLGKPKWAIISGSELNSAMLRRLIFLMEDLPIIN